MALPADFPLPYGWRAPSAEDRAEWAPGPWEGEEDCAHGWASVVPWVVLRTPEGHLVGYAGVGPTSPFWGLTTGSLHVLEPTATLKDADYVVVAGNSLRYLRQDPKANLVLPCHGGISYARENGNWWWLGFDAAHAGDLTPRHNHAYCPDDAYRNLEYMTTHARELAYTLATKRPKDLVHVL